ncbi:ABC transporter substrate-binding protein [Paenibacillus tarimensis]
MRLRKKKVCSVMFAAIVLILIMAGCSQGSKDGGNMPAPAPSDSVGDKKKELESVDLIWYYGVGLQQQDQQSVEDEVNKYLKEKTDLNVTLKLKPVEFGSYDQKLNVAIASGEPMDIVWTTASWLLKYNENVKKGAFLALDDLLPTYAPKTLNEMMPKRYWDDVKAGSDGKIYAIPNYQIAATSWGFIFQKRFVDKYKFDITKVKKYEDLEPFLETLKNNEPDIIPFANPGGGALSDDPNFRNYANIFSYDINDPFKIMNKVDTSQYKAVLDVMHKWYQKGYIYKDIATVKDRNLFFKKGNVAVSTDVTFKPGGEVEYAVIFGNNEIVSQRISSPVFTGVTATMNAIAKASKNPERALMLLERVNNDKELYKLLCYGIEGKHYTEEDGVYKAVEGTGYRPEIDWVFGNQFNGLLRTGQPEDVFGQTIKRNEEAEIPPMSGFHFNDSSLKTELAAVASVKAEYAVPLETGTVDPDVVLPRYKEALKKAGQDKIMAEINRQYTEWAASNAKK